MLPDSLTTKNNAQTASTFVGVKASNMRRERILSTANLTYPTMLVTDHSKTGPKGNESYRHLLQASVVESDGNGGTVTTVVNLTISVPTRLPVASTAPKDCVAYITSLILAAGATNTVFDSVLQNQS